MTERLPRKKSPPLVISIKKRPKIPHYKTTNSKNIPPKDPPKKKAPTSEFDLLQQREMATITSISTAEPNTFIHRHLDQTLASLQLALSRISTTTAIRLAYLSRCQQTMHRYHNEADVCRVTLLIAVSLLDAGRHADCQAAVSNAVRSLADYRYHYVNTSDHADCRHMASIDDLNAWLIVVDALCLIGLCQHDMAVESITTISKTTSAGKLTATYNISSMMNNDWIDLQAKVTKTVEGMIIDLPVDCFACKDDLSDNSDKIIEDNESISKTGVSKGFRGWLKERRNEDVRETSRQNKNMVDKTSDDMVKRKSARRMLRETAVKVQQKDIQDHGPWVRKSRRQVLDPPVIRDRKPKSIKDIDLSTMSGHPKSNRKPIDRTNTLDKRTQDSNWLNNNKLDKHKRDQFDTSAVVYLSIKKSDDHPAQHSDRPARLETVTFRRRPVVMMPRLRDASTLAMSYNTDTVDSHKRSISMVSNNTKIGNPVCSIATVKQHDSQSLSMTSKLLDFTVE